MAGPFYNAIKSTTAGAAGTGAFTPNAASSGYLAWSTVPTGWMGLVRFEDGTAWELQYSYWNGTTLSRAATTQFVSSSTGSALTLTSAATAAMVADANEISPHPVVHVGLWSATFGALALSASGITAVVPVGNNNITTTISTSSALNLLPRVQYISAITANALAGIVLSNGAKQVGVTSTAGLGGYEFVARFGSSALVTGQRLFVGVTDTTQSSSAVEPSANPGNYAVLGLDSTDTNLQLLVRDGTTSAKTNTGIPFVAGGLYEVSIWVNPGSLTTFMLLMRLDTGAIFYGSTATNVPVAGTGMFPQILGGLSAANATAFVLDFNRMTLRMGGA